MSTSLIEDEPLKEGNVHPCWAVLESTNVFNPRDSIIYVTPRYFEDGTIKDDQARYARRHPAKL